VHRETSGAPCDEASLFFVVVDERSDEPVGVMRVITPSPAGSKSLNDLEPVWERSWPLVIADTPTFPASGPVWDIATLAVVPAHRGAATSGVQQDDDSARTH
jgi:hypothetical protein